MTKSNKKRNWIIRIALIVLVLTLATACMVSGTFAKYVTSGTGTSTAQVAAWGITLSAEVDDTFDTSTDTGVLQSTSTFYIAPGTTGSITFGYAGTAEVAFSLAAALEVEYVGSWYSDAALTAYAPITWSLTGTGIDTAITSLETINSTLTGTATEYAAGSTLTDTSYTLTWAWDFDDSTVGTNDASDTYLGELAANAGSYIVKTAVTDEALTDLAVGDIIDADTYESYETSYAANFEAIVLPEITIELTLTATQLDTYSAE